MKREVIIADPQTGEAAFPQYGAICWRKSDAGFDILLITSRETGRWVIPKGWPIKGLGAAAVAAQEAWEEAGVEGKPGDTCLGVFGYRKVLPGEQSVACLVALYGLRVEKLARQYPEQHQRKRRWFSLPEAAAVVAEPELSAFLLALDRNAPETGTKGALKFLPPLPAPHQGNG